jgi:F-type H+-transporting ATPase subunit epsilon
MAEKFKVELVTPKGRVLDKEVEEVIAPGIMGEFGVLIGHTPMLTFIKPGILSYLENDTFTRFAVGPGFCEVLKDSMTVLVEEAHSVNEIDESEANAEVSHLEQVLVNIDSATDPYEYKKTFDRLNTARAKVALITKS